MQISTTSTTLALEAALLSHAFRVGCLNPTSALCVWALYLLPESCAFPTVKRHTLMLIGVCNFAHSACMHVLHSGLINCAVLSPLLLGMDPCVILTSISSCKQGGPIASHM